MNKIPDEDLRKQLKSLGEDVGPLDSFTRPYWEKRLAQLLAPTSKGKKKTAQTGNTKNVKFPVDIFTKRNKMAAKEPVKIPIKNKKLIDNFKEFGVKVPKGPLKDADQMKPDSLMADVSSKIRTSKRKLEPSQSESANYLENKKLIDNLTEFEVKVPEEPLKDAATIQKQKKPCSLMADVSSKTRNSKRKSEPSQSESANYLEVTDLELINNLNAFGIQVSLEPMNDVTRHACQKTLEHLKSGSTGTLIRRKTDNKRSPPPSLIEKNQASSQTVPVEQLNDMELKDQLKRSGIRVPRGPLNEASRSQFRNMLRKLKTGVSRTSKSR